MISNCGNVRGPHGYVLSPVTHKGGYKSIRLHHYGMHRNFLVHRLVAKAFLPPRPKDKLEVNHKDLNPANNKWTNLEWVTNLENIRHRNFHNKWQLGNPAKIDKPRHPILEEKSLRAQYLEGQRKLVANRRFTQSRRGRKRRSRYNETYNEFIVNNNQRNSVVSRLARFCVKKGKYVIILVSRIQHVKNISARLEDVPHRLVYGEKKVKDRQRSTKNFEKGKIKLIIANQVFKKGVNIKRVDVIIDAAAMKSQNDAIQKFGRGVRKHADKIGLMYFDISDVDPAPIQVRKKIKGERVWRTRYHNFHVAAKHRKRAYSQVGLPMRDFNWEDDGEVKELYLVAEKSLRKRLANGNESN